MTAPKVEALNIGLPAKELFHGREVTTGICKKPVRGPLSLDRLGFEGDGVADQKHHGGTDKAVCVYSVEHYPFWEKTLGVALPLAPFGENLSVSNLQEDDVSVGDVFQLGTAEVQVSQPRQPCRTLAARYGRSDLIKLVVDSGRTGFYLRVLKKGIVERCDRLILKEREPRRVSISFANRIFHHNRDNRSGIGRVLAVPALSESWQKSFRRLQERCSAQ
jgi:MOSC domain-containing protein YiiM